MEILYLKLLFIDIIGGGSGRLFEITSGITFRYIMFFLGLLILLYKFCFSKIMIKKEEMIVLLLGTFFIPLGFVSLGVNDLSLAFDDIKPFLFFLLSFIILSQSEENSKLIIDKFLTYLIVVPVLMGIIQIILILMIKYNFLSFYIFYALGESTSNEIMFRGEDGLFFYKGFFFLGVGCIYAFIKKKYFVALFLFICIYLTQTRGLLLASIFSILLYIIFTTRKQIAFIFFLISPVIFYLLYLITLKILFLREDVADSDVVRFKDLEFLLDIDNFFHALFGHGWGAEIRDRAKLENVFMEIFYKSGILGLLSSFVIVIYIFLHKNNKYNPFLYFTVFSFLFSQTNPFIFTPMGIILLIVSMLSLRYFFDVNSNIVR